MFEQTSRYYDVETAQLGVQRPDGTDRLLPYKRRRFVPPSEGMTTLLEHTVAEGDRLDNLAARYVGDPEEFWRICDANDALRPEELTEEPGRSVRISVPRL